jgi:hypothetical protein
MRSNLMLTLTVVTTIATLINSAFLVSIAGSLGSATISDSSVSGDLGLIDLQELNPGENSSNVEAVELNEPVFVSDEIDPDSQAATVCYGTPGASNPSIIESFDNGTVNPDFWAYTSELGNYIYDNQRLRLVYPKMLTKKVNGKDVKYNAKATHLANRYEFKGDIRLATVLFDVSTPAKAGAAYQAFADEYPARTYARLRLLSADKRDVAIRLEVMRKPNGKVYAVLSKVKNINNQSTGTVVKEVDITAVTANLAQPIGLVLERKGENVFAYVNVISDDIARSISLTDANGTKWTKRKIQIAGLALKSRWQENKPSYATIDNVGITGCAIQNSVRSVSAMETLLADETD